MMPLIRLKEIVKRYGEILALNRLNLEVNRGEILAVLGPNGAGKTTLLKIIAGIEEPTSGEIYYNDSIINKGFSSFIRQRCTMVFQRTIVFNTTVYNNIAYGLKIRRRSKAEIDKRVHEALRIVKLEGYEKRNAKKLSGGEQQRVSIARALVLEPEILLLDEPTANLDPRTTSIIEEVIRYVNRELETTVLIATHNIFQVGNVADRAAFMLNGRVIESGPLKDLLNKPSLKIADFTRLENVFHGIAKPLSTGTSIIDIGDSIYIEAAFEKTGPVTVFIQPEDIIVSKKPIESSARNIIKGRIIEIIDHGPIIRLKVDTGKIFTAQITRQSFKDMNLNIGSEIYLVYKASSVSLL